MSGLKEASPASPRGDIDARAVEFIQRRRFQRWTDADQRDLDAWLDESTLHRVAFLRLEMRAERIERLADLRSPRRSITVELPRLRFPFRIIMATAAATSLIVVLGLAARQYVLKPIDDRVYSTDVGGHATLRFADRTEIELNTDTVVRYRMTTTERTVWLERGEAYFRVAHNANNPFTVIAGNHKVTDIGTEFLVQRDVGGVPNRLEVALVKGRAEFSSEGPHAQVAMLAPGDEAIATSDSISFSRKTAKQLEDELGWQRGVLAFHDMRLADVVAEFNRYNETKLIIADPSIANVKFSAEVPTDDYEDFLHLAETVQHLQVKREGHTITLSQAHTQRSSQVSAAKN